MAQGTFDEAVHDNIETFEMEPDEAVRACRSLSLPRAPRMSEKGSNSGAGAPAGGYVTHQSRRD